jgi:hypothetical protein
MDSLLIDFYRYLLHFLPQILIAAPLLFFGFEHLKTERRWRWTMGIAAAIAAGLALVGLAAEIPQATHHDWSACRLAPTLAWLKGYHLYYPKDQGPVLIEMYGPISAIVYIPAALAARPTVAILIGAFTNSLFYMAPAACFMWRSRRSQPPLFVVAAFALFAVISMLRQFVLAEASSRVTIDAPALGIATCALAVLAGSRLDAPLRTGVVCGILAGLSMWTKLTLAPIVFVLPLYVVMTRDLRTTLRFTLALFAGIAIVWGVVFAWFGSALWFQNVVVPSSQSWRWADTMGSIGALRRALRELWRYARPLGLLLIVAILFRPKLPRVGEGRFALWARGNPWILPLLAMLAVILTAALAYVKIGGAYNNAATPGYFALLTAVSSLSIAAGSVDPERQRIRAGNQVARLALLALLVIAGWPDAGTRDKIRAGLALWSHLDENPHEQAYQYLRTHGGDEAYFPEQPIATLLATGKIYHFSTGLDSLNWANAPVSEAQLHGWLPSKMAAVYYPQYALRPSVLQRLPEFDVATTDPEMPGWIVMRAGRPSQ